MCLFMYKGINGDVSNSTNASKQPVPTFAPVALNPLATTTEAKFTTSFQTKIQSMRRNFKTNNGRYIM